MKNKQIALNIGMIASIISYHYYESIYKELSKGSAETHAEIAECARLIEIRQRNVKEWENYVNRLNNKEISCWDDHTLYYTRKYFKDKFDLILTF